MLLLPKSKRDVHQQFLSSAFPWLLISIISLSKYALVNALSSSRLRMQMHQDLSSSTATASNNRRNRLSQALSSPVQGKVSISPEISIPESFDPTALLLQTTHINHLSESLRTRAKANAIFWSTTTTTSLDSLKQFEEEQQTSHGKIPSPLPIIYCCPPTAATTLNSDLLTRISSLGVCGILVPINDGIEISNTDELVVLHHDNDDKQDIVLNHSIYEKALSYGLHAIPEITLHPKSSWTDSDVVSLVSTIQTKFGFVNPVAIAFTFGSSSSSTSTDNNDEEKISSLPISKLPTKDQIGGMPILGSVRAMVGTGTGGDDRLHSHVSTLKAAGFSGVILRSDCVPYLGSSNIEFLTKFWCSVITQLKSVRSKAFGGFRTKNQLDDTTGANAWAKYTSKLLDEGVLPSSAPETSTGSSDFNTDRGDYKGF